MPASRPIGVVTRGTTAPNRLRRVDRWVAWAAARALRAADDPLVVDLGFGASPVTALELHQRLRAVRPDVRVVGVEVDPARVAAARPLERPGVRFVVGGFELPVDGAPVVVRACNVLRQYAEAEVAPAWDLLRARLAPDGVLVDGTCDELGRRATWVDVGAEGPRALVLSTALRGLPAPGELAERLPKALIHRNVPGEGVHALLQALDRAWAVAAPLGPLGAVQRWRAACAAVRDQGLLRHEPARWRLGECSAPWPVVAPRLTTPGAAVAPGDGAPTVGR